MTDSTDTAAQQSETKPAREWLRTLAAYRESDVKRSCFELAITMGPFIGLWALAWMSLSYSYWLTLAISLVNAGFLLRLFAIQHDCGHGAFFDNRTVSDWIGRVLGVLTVTPYDVWRRQHAIHHGTHGNLDQRGIGDIHTMTVAEYRDSSRFDRFVYRLYRHPVVLFGLGPGYLFLLQNRVPFGLTGVLRYWLSAMATNAAILVALAVVVYFGGLAPVLLIFLPSTLLAATAGMWLFYVQHQFEDTHWESSEEWQLHEAAMEGSSHYVLPRWMQWLSANIGIHHVHHVHSRIPFYRLPEVLRDHAVLANVNRITIRESLATARLHLWDEDGKRLLSFRQARALLRPDVPVAV